MVQAWNWGKERRAEEQAPPGIDITKPSAARIYDALLGGKDNFQVDREAAELVLRTAADSGLAVRENRAFLQRAVRFCVAHGIRQFLDLGTGLPTQGNVHEVALALAPESRVVYVDNDPIVLTHGRALLVDTGSTTVIQADMREPEDLLARPELRTLLDLDRPVAVLLLAVLHFLTDEEARHTLRVLHEAMAPSSLLVISHVCADNDPAKGVTATEAWRETSSGIHFRDHASIERFFDGFTLLEPGLVWQPDWHPDHPTRLGTSPEWCKGGVARRDQTL